MVREMVQKALLLHRSLGRMFVALFLFTSTITPSFAVTVMDLNQKIQELDALANDSYAHTEGMRATIAKLEQENAQLKQQLSEMADKAGMSAQQMAATGMAIGAAGTGTAASLTQSNEALMASVLANLAIISNKLNQSKQSAQASVGSMKPTSGVIFRNAYTPAINQVQLQGVVKPIAMTGRQALMGDIRGPIIPAAPPLPASINLADRATAQQSQRNGNNQWSGSN